MKNNLIIIGVAITSYLIMAFLITLWQSGVFHQVISYNKSTPFVLIVGGMGTIVCSVVAGWMAGRFIKFKNYLPHIIMSLLVCIESTYLITKDKTGDPVWFDILAGFSLIIGIFAGYMVGKKMTAELNQSLS